MSDEIPRPETDAPAQDPELLSADAPSPDAEPAEPEALLDPAEQMQADLARLRDQVLRSAADFQNYRRRATQDLARATEHGRADAVTALLDVVDDLTRTVEAADAAAPSADAFTTLKQGLDLVYQKLIDGLDQLGVQPIAAQGQPFDENLHEALLQQDAPEGTAPGTVIGVMQPGYTMGERVLRHARVSVSR